jgi:hypothetical protein
MKKPGETIADVISRIVKIYKSRTEELESYKLWREARSKVELLEEENRKQENRVIELEEENKRLKQVTNEYMSTQLQKAHPHPRTIFYLISLFAVYLFKTIQKENWTGLYLCPLVQIQIYNLFIFLFMTYFK